MLAADHVTPASGKTPTVVLRKNNVSAAGSFASPAGTVREVGQGWYQVDANAADVDTLGPLVLNATASGCDPFADLHDVVAYDPNAGSNLGLTNLDATISSRLAASGYTAPPAAAAVAAAVLSVALTESYAAANAAPTLAQLMLLVGQMLSNMTISGTTMTVYKLDGATPAATFSLNSATAPTSIVRAS